MLQEFANVLTGGMALAVFIAVQVIALLLFALFLRWLLGINHLAKLLSALLRETVLTRLILEEMDKRQKEQTPPLP